MENKEITVIKIKTLNQLSEQVKELARKHGVFEEAMCGFLATINAVVISELVSHGTELEEVGNFLGDKNLLLPKVEQFCLYIKKMRSKYIETHADEFTEERSKEDYINGVLSDVELSRAMKQRKDFECFSFARNVCWGQILREESIRFPLESFQQREEERLFAKEVEPFQNSELFFQMRDKYLDSKDWIRSQISGISFPFVINFWGHFVVIVLDFVGNSIFVFDSHPEEGEYENLATFKELVALFSNEIN